MVLVPFRDGAPGSFADAESEHGDRARLGVAERFQVDPAEAWGREADTVAEKHRQDIHQDLVDEPSLKALAGQVGAEDLQVLAARSVARRGDGFLDVAGEERDPGSGSSGGSWVRTNWAPRRRRCPRRPSACRPRRCPGR